ncbi:Uncharacterised protein [Salmonella enterica subsp. enterica serovar Typhimurium]|nr:Uncharacterised protein [Salmonella enterica subsp. enterica serovar Typhimurium]
MLSGCVAFAPQLPETLPGTQTEDTPSERVKYGRNDDVPDGASFIRQGRIRSVTPPSGTTSSVLSLAWGGESRLFLYLKNLSG